MTPNSVERYGCSASNRQNSKSFAQIRGARIRRWRAEVRRKSALMISNGCDRKPALTVLFDTIGRGPPITLGRRHEPLGVVREIVWYRGRIQRAFPR